MIRWQSSNVPSTAMQCTFGSGTVVICSSWRRLVRPSGNRMKTRTFDFPRSAAIAALPVSPLVAPRTFRVSPERPSS